MNKFNRGDLVTINHFDRPCTRLIAVVKSCDNGLVNAVYLTTGTILKKCYAPIENVTLISDFGVNAKIYDGVVSCDQMHQSIAKYKDATPRSWQEEPVCVFPVRKEALEILDEGKRTAL